MRFSMFAVYCLLVLLAGSMVVASPTNWRIYTLTSSTDWSDFGVYGQLGVTPVSLDGYDGWRGYDGAAIDFGSSMPYVKCSAAMLTGGGSYGYPDPWLFDRDMKSTASYTTYSSQEKKWTFFVGGLDQSTGDILLQFRTAGSTQLMVDAQTGDWRFYLRLVDNKGRDVKVPTWAGGDGSASWWVGQAYQIMVPTSTSTYFGPTMLPELRVFGYDNPNMFMSQAYKLEFIQAPATRTGTPPTVSSVSAHQREDGTGSVDIWYDLADFDSPSLTVTVALSSDGGASYSYGLASLQGDAGPGIAPGTTKHIVWNSVRDLPSGNGSTYRVAVTANDAGSSSTGYSENFALDNRPPNRLRLSFDALTSAIADYQFGCISVIVDGDVHIARKLASDANVKTQLKNFGLDLLAGDGARIAGKMAAKGATKTAQWYAENILPKLIAKVAAKTWIAASVEEWTRSIQPDWSDAQIFSYLLDYFWREECLGSLVRSTYRINDDFAAQVPASLPDNVPVERIIHEMNSLQKRVAKLTPLIGRTPAEGEVYWAVPGAYSLDPFGNLNPVLLGASSYAADDLRFAARWVDAVGTTTDIRRKACIRWTVGGGVTKIVATLTIVGAPPAEALYWGGVAVCQGAGTAGAVLDASASWLALHKQFEAISTLDSDVQQAHDFLQAVSAQVIGALGSGQTGSTSIKLWPTWIPDAEADWLSQFADVSASWNVTNNGPQPAVCRAVMDVYRKRSKTYDDLVIRVASQSDLTIQPSSTEAFTFNFQVPAGNLLFADDYYARCLVISNAGAKVSGAYFKACQPGGCYSSSYIVPFGANLLISPSAWERILDGTVSAGESRQVTVQVPAGVPQVEFLLDGDDSGVDLHVYDSSGRHAGADYDAGTIDLDIPGSTYSGTDSAPETIGVPTPVDRTLTVEVVGRSLDEPTDFFVLEKNISYRPATLSTVPARVYTGGNIGEPTGFDILVGESGGQESLTDVEVSVSDVTSDYGEVIPASAFTIEASPTVIPAGTQSGAHFSLSLPSEPGDYTGTITVTTSVAAASIPLTVHVEIPNVSPVANAGPDQVLEATSPTGTIVRLDGSGSSDANSSPGTNDDITLFEWVFGETVIATGEEADILLPTGEHSITLRVTDSQGVSDEDEVVVTVQDTTGPAITITPGEGSYLIDAANPLSISASVSDIATGVANVTATLNGALVVLPCEITAPGDYQLAVTAVDNAGNATTLTYGYRVYDLIWLPPIVHDKAFQAGSTIPIKFSVWDDTPRFVTDLGPIVTITGPEPSTAIVWSGNALYMYGSDPYYQALVRTKGCSPGTYKAAVSCPSISNTLEIPFSLK